MSDQAPFRGALRDDLLRALIQVVAGQRVQQQLMPGNNHGPAGIGRVAAPDVSTQDAAGPWIVECLVGEVVILRDAGKDEGGKLVHPVSLRSDPETSQGRIIYSSPHRSN